MKFLDISVQNIQSLLNFHKNKVMKFVLSKVMKLAGNCKSLSRVPILNIFIIDHNFDVIRETL